MLNKPLPDFEHSMPTRQSAAADMVAAATKGAAGKAPTADTTPQKDDNEPTALGFCNNDDDDTTQATNDTTHTSTNAAAGNEKEGEEGERPEKKKRKKRASKKTVAKLKEVRKDFMNRCVSPEYKRINRIHLNAEVSLINLKGLDLDNDDAVYRNTRSKGRGGKNGDTNKDGQQTKDQPEKKSADTSVVNSDDNGDASSDDEPYEDYQIDGYHVVHVK